MSDILKTKIPFSLALLIIVAMGAGTEQLFLQGMKVNNQACNSVAAINWTPNRTSLSPWLKNIKEKVALPGANIPLIPGAKRMTFDNNRVVRYRVAAPANLVAGFYRQILTSRGWKASLPTSASDKLTIAFTENPLSNKTDVTYAYVPLNATLVLGVKIAEADLSAPAPQPAPEQYQQQPSQPLPDGQLQPLSQPTMNQMEFSRPPTQPYPGDQSTNQTCRINGVEMPGSCEKYNSQGPTNQDPNGQGDQIGQPGQPGPSEEEMKKNDERRFKDMKKGLSQFANGAKMMKKSIAKIKIANSKCGVGTPEELVNALAQTDSLIEKINNAKTADELEEIVGDVQDVGSVMQDWGPRMGDLSRLCQMIKQANRDAKQFDRNIKRMESQAKANKKIDLSELIAEYKTSVNAQKETLAQTKELAKTDQDSSLTKIEDDFYGNMDNLGNLQMQIDTIVNISKGLRDITRELNAFTSQIKTLTKKKVNTTDMQEMLNNLKTQVAEIKNLVKGKVDAEELISKVEEAFDIRQELQDALQEYDMIKMTPQVNSGSGYNVKVNLPEAFRKDENNNDNGEAAEEPSAKAVPTSASGSGGGVAVPKP